MRTSSWLWVAAGLALLAGTDAQAAGYSFRVKHPHAIGSCEGTLTIRDEDVRYQTDHRADARIWLYPRIKRGERKGLRRLILHTYEDQPLKLGRDRTFHFELLDGVISDEVFNFLVVRVGQSSGPASPVLPGGRYEVAAKHRHTAGGCHGTLRITQTQVEYATANTKDSRVWKFVDIKQLSQPSPYRLSLRTYEDQAWQFGRDRVFTFELKQPLEPAVVEFIRSRMSR